MSLLGVIRVRGTAKVNHQVAHALSLLSLNKVHNFTICPSTQVAIGSLRKVQNYVTWGELSSDMLISLLEKRARVGNRAFTDEDYKRLGVKDAAALAAKLEKGEMRVQDAVTLPLKLAPPRRGWERGGIRKAYQQGGALGNRGAAINDTLRRML